MRERGRGIAQPPQRDSTELSEVLAPPGSHPRTDERELIPSARPIARSNADTPTRRFAVKSGRSFGGSCQRFGPPYTLQPKLELDTAIGEEESYEIDLGYSGLRLH